MVKTTVPRPVVSSISDASTVVAKSMRFLLRLPLHEGKLIGVCSLMTSMTDLGSQSVRGDRPANQPQHNLPYRRAVAGLPEGYGNEREVDEPSASVGNGVEKRGANCGSSKVWRHMDEMERLL